MNIRYRVDLDDAEQMQLAAMLSSGASSLYGRANAVVSASA